MSPANAYQLIEVGANALVAGSAVFGAKDYAEGESPWPLLPPSPLIQTPGQDGQGLLDGQLQAVHATALNGMLPVDCDRAGGSCQPSPVHCAGLEACMLLVGSDARSPMMRAAQQRVLALLLCLLCLQPSMASRPARPPAMARSPSPPPHQASSQTHPEPSPKMTACPAEGKS